MDPGKDEESRPQPSGPPTRRKFVIPLEEEEVPCAGFQGIQCPLLTTEGNQECTWCMYIHAGQALIQIVTESHHPSNLSPRGPSDVC
uniref:Excision repair cross-complementing rodent repair deficiency, complementation group 1 n=1 Tax=Mus musculus TaxID=10090 RepID=H3BJK4_MOUSE